MLLRQRVVPEPSVHRAVVFGAIQLGVTTLPLFRSEFNLQEDMYDVLYVLGGFQLRGEPGDLCAAVRWL